MPFNVNNALNNAWNAVTTTTGQAADAVNDAAQTAAQTATETAEQAGQWVDGQVDAVGEAAAQAIDEHIEQALDDAKHMVDSAWQKASKIVSKVADHMTGAAQMIAGVAKDAVETIVKDPLRFVGRLGQSLSRGMGQFVENVRSHVIGGTAAWLGKTFEDAGIERPERFTAKALAKLGLDVLGLTAQTLRQKAAKLVG